MGCAIGLGVDKGVRVRIAAPGLQHFVCQVANARRLIPTQAQYGHGPLDDSGLNVFISGKGIGGLYRCLGHSKGIVPALEVLVGENGAAHDGKVCIGAYKIVGKLLYKIKQLLERAAVDFHRRMPAIKHNAVLVIVAVWRILQEPGTAAHFQGNDPVVLPCRVIDPSGVALVLLAQLTLGVSALLHLQGSRNGLGVLLRLG